MQVRLVHQLSLLLIATAVLAVAAVSGVVAWNLRAGFVDYLRAQDEQWLDRLMQVAERDLAQRAELPSDWRPALRGWLDSMAEADGLRPRRLEPPPRGPDFLRGERAPRPPAGPSAYGPRLLLLEPEGRWVLAGHRLTQAQPGQLRALKRQGQTVALLRLAERDGPPEGVEAGFLRRQYLGLLAVALAVVALALAAARWAATRWVQPLRDAQLVTRRIARGELSVRLPAHRDDELGALTQDINAMAESLQRLESSRQRWIAELSHELRTPLAVLRGEIEALLDGVRPLGPAALASLQDEVRRLTRLIEDFHTLASSELRALPCRLGPVAVTALLAEAVARVGTRAEAQGLSLRSDWPASLPQALWDGERIAQLLANLLENSLRYTDAPGQLILAARPFDGLLEIELDDSAPGVPAAALPHLFDPLFRVESSRSRAGGGSGLGLAIAQAIAHSHGGRLEALASPLGGLRMRLRLPLRPPAAAAPREPGR